MKIVEGEFFSCLARPAAARQHLAIIAGFDEPTDGRLPARQ